MSDLPEAFDALEELAASHGEQLCPLRAEKLHAVVKAALSANGGEVVAWQFYQDGKWYFGDDTIKDHRANTEAAGFPIRELFTTPPSFAVPEGWSVRQVEDQGNAGFIVGSPRVNGVRTNTSVWRDDEDPAHQLLAHMLAGDILQVTAYDHSIPVTATSSDDEQPVIDPDGLPSGLAAEAAKHLTNWLNMDLCECEGGHTCGATEVRRCRDQLLKAADAPSPDHTADAGKVVASNWKSAKNGQCWPHIGGKYLIKLNGVLQHEIYEFDQGDDGMGGGEYFWAREDLDEAVPFNPEKDEWLSIDEAGTATPSMPENAKARAILDSVNHAKANSAVNRGLGTVSESLVLKYALAMVGDVSGVLDIRGELERRLRTAGDEGEE